jgi:hypothetical protein
LEQDGGPSKHRPVSRRLLDGSGDPGVAFEVVGRNPVVVRRSSSGRRGGSSRVFRRREKGDPRPGDALSLSLKAPSFWAVRRKGRNGEWEVEASVLDAVARRERRTRERKERARERIAAEESVDVTKEAEEAGSEIDLASIDPVKGELVFFFVTFQGSINSVSQISVHNTPEICNVLLLVDDIFRGCLDLLIFYKNWFLPLGHKKPVSKKNWVVVFGYQFLKAKNHFLETKITYVPLI